MSNVLTMDTRAAINGLRSIEDYPEIMKVKDVKAYLRVGDNATYDFLNHPKCPTFRIGSSIRIRRDRLLQFIDEW